MQTNEKKIIAALVLDVAAAQAGIDVQEEAGRSVKGYYIDTWAGTLKAVATAMNAANLAIFTENGNVDELKTLWKAREMLA